MNVQILMEKLCIKAFKSTLNAILILALFLSPLAGIAKVPKVPADAEQPEPELVFSAESELAFLNTVRARVQLYMELNLKMSEQMVRCFRGEIVSPECENRKRQVQNVIQSRYPLMRRTLLLYNMVQGNTLSALSGNIRFYDSSAKKSADNKINEIYPYGYGIHPYGMHIFPTENPLQSMLTDNPLTGWTIATKVENPDFQIEEYKDALFSENSGNIERILELEPPGLLSPAVVTKTEKTNIPKNFKEYFKLLCQLGTQPGKYVMHWQKPENCERIRIEWDVARNRGLFLYFDSKGLTNQQAWDAKESIRLAFSGYNLFRQQYTSQLLADFHEIVGMHPYLALLKSGKPSDTEIATAFEKVNKAANSNYINFRKKFPVDLREQDLDQKDRLIIMDYSPVIAHAIESPSLEMELEGSGVDYTMLAAKLSRERAMSQLKRAGWNFGILLGINVACFLPWGRIAKLATFSKGMCLSALTIPIGAFFVHESYMEYKRVFHELFGVPAGIAAVDERDENNELDTGERYLAEMAGLRSAERFLIFDLITAPIGAGMALKYLSSSSLRLSLGLRSRVQSAIVNYRKAI